MMPRFITILLLTISNLFLSQNYKITYQSFFEGKPQEDKDKIIVYTNSDESYIFSENLLSKNTVYPYEINKILPQTFTVYSYGFLRDNEIITLIDEKQLPDQKFTYAEDTKKILGYECKKAIIYINSNTIELWYTHDLKKLKGSPSLLGQNLDLVLEITRNGTYTTRAIAIKKEKKQSCSRNDSNEYRNAGCTFL